MKSRTLSDMKPIKPKKCEFDSINCTPACKYYKTCIHSLHKQYETTLKRVVLTTDKKLLYQAEYNRKMRAAQRQQ